MNPNIRLIAWRLLLVFLVYQLCRLLFFTIAIPHANVWDSKSFLGGLLFDASAIGYINLLFVLLHLWPGPAKWNAGYQKALKIAFFGVNFLFIATNFIDFQYFKFTGRRSSFSMLRAEGMENELPGLILSFLQEFWYLPLLLIALGVVFWKAMGRLQPVATPAYTLKNVVRESGIAVLAIGICFAMGRGVGKKPLRIVDAAQYNHDYAAFVLNTPFTLLKTLGKKENVQRLKHFEQSELAGIFSPIVTTQPQGAPNQKNAVLIILESFGRENLGIGQTPFLDSLLQQSLYFPHGFANGKLSIDAVPSTLSSLPSLMNQSYITSPYAVNHVYGLPKILKENGYTTSFFHGAFNGSQNFDQYCKMAGFDHYYGKNEYDGPEAFDGKWGIFDEEFLQFKVRELSKMPQPFFSTVFTISSHNPYTIPARYAGKFPKGKTRIAESIAYSDYALRQFFATARQQPWYSNTVFIITADHTSAEPTAAQYETAVGKFSIPIAFYDPSNSQLQGESPRVMQQIDIMPSLVEYLNIPAEMIAYGKPLSDPRDFAVFYLDNVYHYIEGNDYLKFDGEKALGLYSYKTDVLLQTNRMQQEVDRVQQMQRFLKAYLQSFNNRLLDNQLVLPQHRTQ